MVILGRVLEDLRRWYAESHPQWRLLQLPQDSSMQFTGMPHHYAKGGAIVSKIWYVSEYKGDGFFISINKQCRFQCGPCLWSSFRVQAEQPRPVDLNFHADGIVWFAVWPLFVLARVISCDSF